MGRAGVRAQDANVPLTVPVDVGAHAGRIGHERVGRGGGQRTLSQPRLLDPHEQVVREGDELDVIGHLFFSRK